MKGEKTLAILALLKEGALEATDVFEAFLRAGYGASSRRLNYERNRIRLRREQKSISYIEKRHARQRYDNLVSFLRRDGLIQRTGIRKKSVLSITHKGRVALQKLFSKKQEELPATRYVPVSSNTFVICVFDIPERERRKRAWLRAALQGMGMHLIQKSVWLGKIKIPNDFLDAVDRIKILPYIEIFEITKSGSLRHIQ
jgi:CRISPR/Cas system-associated endoribonuclease Cas2